MSTIDLLRQRTKIKGSRNRGIDAEVTLWKPANAEIIEHVEEVRLAHAPVWYEILWRAYNHTPLYIKAEDAQGHIGMLPAFVISRPFLGKVVTSMPFLDSGGPCYSDPSLAYALIEALVERAGDHGARHVELRSAVPFDLAVPVSQDKVNMVLPLPNDPEELWRSIKGKVRNQVRKAEKSGLTVEFGGAEKLDGFYDVFAINMRDLGSPVHAKRFFQAILNAFDRDARIGLVRHGEQVVGGLVALAFRDTLTVPWASCLRDYFHLCPNMILYWQTLRLACLEGFDKFDFGRSTRNVGTYRFKKQWGAQEEQLFWYRIPLSKRGTTDSHGGAFRLSSLAVDAWKKLPLGLANRLGPKVRQYLTQ